MRPVRFVLIAFGLLDLFSFYRSYPLLLRYLNNITQPGFLPHVQILLILSLIVSGILTITGSRTGYILYYFQFPLKLIFMTLTLGFLLAYAGLPLGGFYRGMMIAFCFGIECARLVLTIRVHYKS